MTKSSINSTTNPSAADLPAADLPAADLPAADLSAGGLSATEPAATADRSPAAAISYARSAQPEWAKQVVRDRMRAIGRIAAQIHQHRSALIALNPRANATHAEIVASELLPLADACRYAARVTRRALAPTTHSARYGAWWMGRIGVQVVREAWGVVLIIAPSNYPLFLPGVQIIQALAAGNAVIVKPAAGCEPLLQCFAQCVFAAGVPTPLLHVLDTSIAAGQQTIDLGVDKVLLTGSADTGRAVLGQLSQKLTPATLELSGCDAVFVMQQANLKRVAGCLAYALRLNGGATCIAPRRVFISPSQEEQLCQLLTKELQSLAVAHGHAPLGDYHIPLEAARKLIGAVRQALAGGARLLHGSLPECAGHPTHVPLPPLVLAGVTPTMDVAKQDLFGPLVSVLAVPSMAAAIEADRSCPYGLGASVFGPPNHAQYWSTQIDAGCVVINDIVVPTADPRVGFGGRDQSGWGLTRGWEGLIDMTRPKVICTRAGSWLPHLDPQLAQDQRSVEALLALFHASHWRSRVAALRTLIARR